MVDERQRARDTVALAKTRTRAGKRFQYSVLWVAGCILLALAVAGSYGPWELYILGILMTTASAWHHGRLSE